MSACGVGQWGKRACAWRKGWWQRWGIVYIQEVCKIKLITKMIGEWFLLLEKGGTNIERKKTRINPLLLDWRWKYQCELIDFNILYI